MAQAAEDHGPVTDAVTLLMTDHRTVEGLFAQFETQTDPQTRRGVVDEIVKELSVHASIEEQIFYPAVRESLPQGDSLVEESLHEHQEVKELLSDLDGMDPADSAFEERVGQLIQEVRHHVEEEERDILPQLQQRISHDRLVDMGETMQRAKVAAPTRPHPHAPATPPGNTVAGPMAGAVDRLRDATRDEG